MSEINLKIISAGAGSGKTFRLTSEMVTLLENKTVRASGIIATTFTKKAAAELQERVRVRLLSKGMTDDANDLANALIGTVHGLGVKLLRRFAFEAGVSPQVDILADEDQQVMFNNALSVVLSEQRIAQMDDFCTRLGLNNKDKKYDWRSQIKSMTDVARANDFSISDLEMSKKKSFETFLPFISASPSSTKGRELEYVTSASVKEELSQQLDNTIAALENGADTTKTTKDAVNELRQLQNELRLRGSLAWHQWAKLMKPKVGAKSRAAVEELQLFAAQHETFLDFRQDIQDYIYAIFDISIAAIEEYEQYKKRRGLIDYIDMEIMVKRLLDEPTVQAVLSEELDLLMVDEFQDTNPIQLEIFFKLSKFAKHSIWVGDPKQSIYGFRGAEPRLMLAIIAQNGGIRKEDIQEHSYRSRQDIVHATNAIFVRAFGQTLDEAQIRLNPKREEKREFAEALRLWYFEPDGEGRQPGISWMHGCIAESIRKTLDLEELYIEDRNTKQIRLAQAGDMAVLCRSNKECVEVAEALNKVGIKAAISRTGLLDTPETKLILACLKYILYKSDSLAIAEILTLASQQATHEIIEHRLDYLEHLGDNSDPHHWAENDAFILKINTLRPKILEFSTTEILNLVIEDLELRRVIALWGNAEQRLDNVEMLRKFANKYEDACNRLHSAASLGGFLLWLSDQKSNDKDAQSSGQSADAVDVVTYHKSKGLEWAVTICHSLEGDLRDSLWGLNIISENETVDLNNLLAGRWLRFWVNPYSNGSKGTMMEERIEESPAKAAAKLAALEEDARVLYVGITRARDYLIFPMRQKATKWLNRVYHKGNDDVPTLDPHNNETPWNWNGDPQPVQSDHFVYPRTHGSVPRSAEEVAYIEQRYGRYAYIPYKIDLEQENFNDQFDAFAKATNQYSPALRLNTDNNIANVAKAVQAFLIADYGNNDLVHRQTIAKGLLQRYEVAEFPEVNDLLELSNNLQAKSALSDILEQSPIQTVYRKLGLSYLYHTRLFETQVDLLLETEEHWVVVLNNNFGSDKVTGKAMELASWCYFVQKALKKHFEAKKIVFLINFVLLGSLVEVVVKEKKDA